MSIDQLEFSRLSQPTPISSKASTKKALPASSFSEALNSATRMLPSDIERNPAVVATTAAELLKLEMMKSALSLSSDTSPSSIGPLTMPARLGVFDLIADSQNSDTASISSQAQQEPAISQRLSHSEESVHEIVNKASQKYGVDGALIKAVIKAESNFDPTAVSHAGAQGLMQLMPATARGLGVSDSFNPQQNVMAGTRFLKDMLDRYHGNLDAALAAYNWGPGNVDRKGISSLPRETRDYLAKVKNLYNQYSA